MFQDPEKARQFLYDPVNVINVHETPDEKFKEYPHAGIIEFFLKKHQERNILKLLEEMQDIWDRLSISIEQKEALIKIILWYNIDKIGSDKNKNEVIDYVNKRFAIEGEEIMKGIAAKWLKEGRQEGRQEGAYESKIQFAKAMLNRKQDISFISEVTGLTMKEILALKNS